MNIDVVGRDRWGTGESDVDAGRGRQSGELKLGDVQGKGQRPDDRGEDAGKRKHDPGGDQVLESDVGVGELVDAVKLDMVMHLVNLLDLVDALVPDELRRPAGSRAREQISETKSIGT